MVLVLQRRVLVMDPRIILRGGIPIDSNIGGYGHRPLFWRGGVSWLVRLSCAFLVLCVAWSCGVVLAQSGLCKDPVFRARNVDLLEPMVLPRLGAVLPLWEARYYRATAWYYRSGAVLRKYRTMRYYRVWARYYRVVKGAWGL